jgi:hypothetical protein
MPYIIVRNKKSAKSGVNQQYYGRTSYSPQTRQQYVSVSKENRKEYQTEKRILELHKKGFNEAAINGMINTGKEMGSEGHIKAVIRNHENKPVIKLDGNL